MLGEPGLSHSRFSFEKQWVLVVIVVVVMRKDILILSSLFSLSLVLSGCGLAVAIKETKDAIDELTGGEPVAGQVQCKNGVICVSEKDGNNDKLRTEFNKLATQANLAATIDPSGANSATGGALINGQSVSAYAASQRSTPETVSLQIAQYVTNVINSQPVSGTISTLHVDICPADSDKAVCPDQQLGIVNISSSGTATFKKGK